MTDHTTSRRLALATLAAVPVALAGCVRADEEPETGENPCPSLVGHRARFIGPNDVVTMDYDPDRVNIYHDENFVITEIAFG